MTPDLDPETDRRTRELQGEIAHTRAELSETIEAIQDRLRPSNIASDAKERVMAATTEKVKNMAETASDTAQSMMRDTRDRAMNLVEGAKQNPIPALMIGAGIAWLLIDRAKGQTDYSRRSTWGEPRSRGYSGYQADSYSALVTAEPATAAVTTQALEAHPTSRRGSRCARVKPPTRRGAPRAAPRTQCSGCCVRIPCWSALPPCSPGPR